MDESSFHPPDGSHVDAKAIETIFERLDDLGAGTIAVDGLGHIVWISEKYLPLLGLKRVEEGIGHDVEEIIPNSLLRRVVETGEAMPLDIMALGERQLVVTRMPIKDDGGHVVGAIGFVLFDRVNALQPLIAKITKLQNDLQAMRDKLHAQRRRVAFDDYIGESPAIREVKRLARRAAEQDTTVLIQGETGTGKEVFARALHAASQRAERPFVAVNCAALPEGLIEAELFGYEEGAFTGARRKGSKGLMREADGGVLFLDEIGDMPFALQARLLRALQEREVTPLGGGRPVPVDFALVCATHQGLAEAVERRSFRQDLYFRIAQYTVELPPLRQRGDISGIVESLWRDFAADNDARLSPAALARLAGYDWPGNFRQLKATLRTLAILAEPGETLDDEALPADIRRATAVAATIEVPVVEVEPATTAAPASLDEVGIAAMRAAVEACGGNVTRAAARLGIHRSTLYRRLYGAGST